MNDAETLRRVISGVAPPQSAPREELQVYDTAGQLIASIDHTGSVVVAAQYRNNPCVVDEIMTALAVSHGLIERD